MFAEALPTLDGPALLSADDPSPFRFTMAAEAGQGEGNGGTTSQSSSQVVQPSDLHQHQAFATPALPTSHSSLITPASFAADGGAAWTRTGQGHMAHLYGQHNTFNTRPMTAPSSMSPSLYGQHYSAAYEHAYHPGGIFPSYPSTASSSVSIPSPGVPSYGFHPSSRHFSMPDMAALPDEPSQSPSNPFLFQPPPLTSPYAAATPSYGHYQQPHAPWQASKHHFPQYQQRPATSAITYPSYQTHTYDTSRPSTSSSRPDTASSSTSTLTGDEDYSPPLGSHLISFPSAAQSQVAVKKRPRRRFEEIERMYKCSYPGCDKGYGTLNHLNAHVNMQRHGPKRLPQEFKELRKAWRDRKKKAAAKREADEDDDREGSRTPEPSARQRAEMQSSPAASSSASPSPVRIRMSHIHPGPAYDGRPSIPVSAESEAPFMYGHYPPPSLAPASHSYAQPAALLPSYHQQHHRPQTAPAPLAFPQPMRPQTAPSADGGPFAFIHDEHPVLSPSLAGYRPPGFLGSGRRSSLPTSSLLPTLAETPPPGDADDGDSLGALF